MQKMALKIVLKRILGLAVAYSCLVPSVEGLFGEEKRVWRGKETPEELHMPNNGCWGLLSPPKGPIT